MEEQAKVMVKLQFVKGKDERLISRVSNGKVCVLGKFESTLQVKEYDTWEVEVIKVAPTFEIVRAVNLIESGDDFKKKSLIKLKEKFEKWEIT